MQKLGYYSLSMGAYFGPIPVALEPRIKVAVVRRRRPAFQLPSRNPAGELRAAREGAGPLDQRPRRLPGAARSQLRLFELLGTPAEHKRHVALEGGHVPNDWRGLIREVLDWFDKYLGPVR